MYLKLCFDATLSMSHDIPYTLLLCTSILLEYDLIRKIPFRYILL